MQERESIHVHMYCCDVLLCVCAYTVAKLERELSSVEALKELKQELLLQREVGVAIL